MVKKECCFHSTRSSVRLYPWFSVSIATILINKRMHRVHRSSEMSMDHGTHIGTITETNTHAQMFHAHIGSQQQRIQQFSNVIVRLHQTQDWRTPLGLYYYTQYNSHITLRKALARLGQNRRRKKKKTNAHAHTTASWRRIRERKTCESIHNTCFAMLQTNDARIDRIHTHSDTHERTHTYDTTIG